MHTNDSNPHTPQPVSPTAAARRERRLNWPLIAGLSALALLWPLAELTGMPSGLGRAAAIIAVTAACWIGVVGFGGFPRPVLTLTLVGVGSGILTHALALAFDSGSGPVLWAIPLSIAMETGWGALAGLVAWGIQSMRPRRPRGSGLAQGPSAPGHPGAPRDHGGAR